ncbi:MAG: DUF4386 domain-containing protein [Thermoleophilia bacterium]
MTATIPTPRAARLTGIAYLGIVVCGLFAEFFVRMSLVTPGDAIVTAGEIAGSPGLFRAGIGADLLMIGLDVAVAFGLYRLFRPFSRNLALAAAGFRLVQAAILTGNLLNLTRADDLAGQAAATGSAGTADRVLQAIETHALVYDIALISFGLSCLVLGRILRTSGVAPRLLALGMTATGCVYLVGSAVAVVAPGLSALIDPFYLVAIVVEPAFALWLILRGGRVASHPPADSAAPRAVGATS